MATATITSRGRVTLPREVRVRLGLTKGDRLYFVPKDDGTYILFAASRSVRLLRGIVPASPAPVTLADMDRAIEAGALGQ